MHILWAFFFSLQLLAAPHGPSLSEFQSENFWGEVKSEQDVKMTAQRFFQAVGHDLSEEQLDEVVQRIQTYESEARELIQPGSVQVNYEHLSGDPLLGPAHYRVFMPSPYQRKSMHLSNQIHIEYYRANMVDKNGPAWPPWNRTYLDSRPAVVLLPHSINDQSDLILFAKIVREFLNFHVLIVSYPHYGLRYDQAKSKYNPAPDEPAHPDFFEFNTSVFYENMKQTAADLQLVHQWMLKIPEINAKEIHFVGLSLGSAIGSVYQGMIESRHTKSFTFIAGGGDWGGTLNNIVSNSKWSSSIVANLLKEMGVTAEEHRLNVIYAETAIWSQFIKDLNVKTINALEEELFPFNGSLLFRESLAEHNKYLETWYPKAHNPKDLSFWQQFTKILLPFLHNMVRD